MIIRNSHSEQSPNEDQIDKLTGCRPGYSHFFCKIKLIGNCFAKQQQKIRKKFDKKVNLKREK